MAVPVEGELGHYCRGAARREPQNFASGFLSAPTGSPYDARMSIEASSFCRSLCIES